MTSSATGPRARADVLAISAYVPGISTLPGANRTVKLSSNENAFGPPPAAQAAYRRVVGELHRYPDGGSNALRQAIGVHHGLAPEQIVCGTGSDELITHLCLIYGGAGTDVLMTEHGFSMYQIAGLYAGSRVIKVPERNLTASVDNLLAAVTPATRLVFVANPNNPTGSLLGQREMERLRRELPPDVLLVIDSAYAEYVEAADYDAGTRLVDAGDNTVMLRTFSKVFGLGGMRVGWAYAPPGVVDALNRVRGAFNVSLPAQEAAVAALSEPGWVERMRTHNTHWRKTLSGELQACGITVWPSVANFILADFESVERAKAADSFLKSAGIIVRGVAGYGLPNCLRITIGTEEDCRLVAVTLAAFTAGEAAHG